MDGSEGEKAHDQVFSRAFIPILKWIYHKSHLCMCTKPKSLISSQWPITAIVWLSYRITVATLTTLMLVFDFTSNVLHFYPDRVRIAKYFIFLTKWGMIVLTICFVTKAYIILRYFSFLESDIEITRTRSLFLFSWIISNISNTISLGITVGYWALVYDGSRIIFLNTINTHVVNSVIILVEIITSEMPIHFAHFYQPLLMGYAYLLFTYIYYVCGGTNGAGATAIYPTLDWGKQPNKTILFNLVGGAVICLVLHSLTAITSWTRTQIAKRVGMYL